MQIAQGGPRRRTKNALDQSFYIYWLFMPVASRHHQDYPRIKYGFLNIMKAGWNGYYQEMINLYKFPAADCFLFLKACTNSLHFAAD